MSETLHRVMEEALHRVMEEHSKDSEKTTNLMLWEHDLTLKVESEADGTIDNTVCHKGRIVLANKYRRFRLEIFKSPDDNQVRIALFFSPDKVTKLRTETSLVLGSDFWNTTQSVVE